MKTKIYLILIFFLLGFQLKSTGQINGYIIFISSNAIDEGFVSVLEDNHYDVAVKRGYYTTTLPTGAALDSLEDASLIIYSRNNLSGTFAGTAELNDFWNGLDVPLVSLSPFPLRSADR